jgi:hypothetical protein
VIEARLGAVQQPEPDSLRRNADFGVNAAVDQGRVEEGLRYVVGWFRQMLRSLSGGSSVGPQSQRPLRFGLPPAKMFTSYKCGYHRSPGAPHCEVGVDLLCSLWACCDLASR